jgi:hypothetical protein
MRNTIIEENSLPNKKVKGKRVSASKQPTHTRLSPIANSVFAVKKPPQAEPLKQEVPLENSPAPNSGILLGSLAQIKLMSEEVKVKEERIPVPDRKVKSVRFED